MANNDNFQVGDVVYLKSDRKNSAMTIADIDNDTAVCLWRDNNGRMEREEVPLVALTKGKQGKSSLTSDDY